MHLRYLLSALLLLTSSEVLAQETTSFLSGYTYPELTKNVHAHEFLKKIQFTENMAAALNPQIRLPNSIMIRDGECGQANAFYNSDQNHLVICHELVASLMETATALKLEGQANDDWVISVLTYIFAHELGHALIDVLDLPVVGREEDAADQFAVLFFLDTEHVTDTETQRNTRKQLADIAQYLATMIKEKPSKDDFADVHSLGEQRLFNTLCLIYGFDPASSSKLGEILGQRIQSCPVEYQATLKAWNNLLAPYETTAKGDGA